MALERNSFQTAINAALRELHREQPGNAGAEFAKRTQLRPADTGRTRGFAGDSDGARTPDALEAAQRELLKK